MSTGPGGKDDGIHQKTQGLRRVSTQPSSGEDGQVRGRVGSVTSTRTAILNK